MSKSAPILFKDLNFTAAATAADRVTQANNIPTLTFPQPQGRGGDQSPAPVVPARAPDPVTPTRAPTKTLKVALPLVTIAHIKQRMVDEQVTQQFILMEALQKGGLPIDDADITEDGRRDR